MQQQQQQSDLVVDVLSPQLARKMRAPMAQAQAPFAVAPSPGGLPSPPPPSQAAPPRAARRPDTDTLFSWNALPNEFIVPIGRTDLTPVLGGSVSKLRARGVLRFSSAVQRIEFRTDNISTENQGVLVEGWACWRVSEPKSAAQKLDLSDPDDPMGKTNKILAIQCAGIMKGLISIKSVNDLLKRREDLIDKLRDKLRPTEERWGISFDEIGISEVQVLSQDVFENLQRPFRNEAREVASASDLETDERIKRREREQRERVLKLEVENEARVRELRATSETQIKSVELGEERKRIVVEQQMVDMRLEEEKRVKALQARLERDLARERKEAERQAELSAITAAQEKELKELQARAARELETVRLQAEQQAQALESERSIQASRKEAELLRLAARRELAQVEQAEAQERHQAEAAARRAEAALQAELRRLELELEGAHQRTRLEGAAREREIAGQLTEAEIRLRLVQALPEIAARIQVGDVRWYGGDAQGGPLNIVPRALDQLLEVAAAHGIELGRRAPAPAVGPGPAPAAS